MTAGYSETALEKLRTMGVNLVPVEMSEVPFTTPMVAMLESEACGCVR